MAKNELYGRKREGEDKKGKIPMSIQMLIFKSIKDIAKISTYLESTLNFVLEMKCFESFIIFLEKINFVRGFPSRAGPTVITDYVITSRSCFFT